MFLKTSHDQYPPFASDITTAPLVSISLTKLEAHDARESRAFFNASKQLGFFYLSMEGSALGEKLVSQAEQLHVVQKEFHALSNAEKEEFAREKIDPFFGYRILGEFEGENGRVLRNENYNVLTLPLRRASCLLTSADAQGRPHRKLHTTPLP